VLAKVTVVKIAS